MTTEWFAENHSGDEDGGAGGDALLGDDGAIIESGASEGDEAAPIDADIVLPEDFVAPN